MVFSSTIFLFIFLPLTLASYYLLPRRFRNYFLLLASLAFYAWGEPRFVFVMIGSIFINYFAALGITYFKTLGFSKRAKCILTIDVLFNLSLFFVFKYLNFTTQNINRFAAYCGHSAVVPQTSILLPIGISFFTFQAMSYVFDVYYEKGQVQKNPLNVLLYVSLFPQLIAGPIVRYQTVADEIESRQESLRDFTKGIMRFVIGLAKKVILANTIAVLVDAAYSAMANNTLTTGMAWLGILAYALQVYFDFSGYSDMAIGLGLMFGFHFLENFDHPYISRTISEFWRRWHISLGSWFRDYLFFPISTSNWLTKISASAGKRWGIHARRAVSSVIALGIVWTCTGIWHGASWNFILWGCYYGVLLILPIVFQAPIKKCTKYLKINTEAKWFHGFQWLRTMLLVLIADVFFRADNLSTGIKYLSSMLGLAPGGLWNGYAASMVEQYVIILIVACLCCLDWKELVKRPLAQLQEHHSTAFWVGEYVLLLLIAIISISFTVASTYNPFIYFNF